MQQVGQDMTCNSDDDKIVNAKVNNESLSYHQLYHEDSSE